MAAELILTLSAPACTTISASFMALITPPTVKGMFNKLDGTPIDANTAQTPVAMDIYYIVPDKCTECVGFHD